MNAITNKGEKVGLLFNKLHKNDVLFKFKRKESNLIIKALVRKWGLFGYIYSQLPKLLKNKVLSRVKT